MDIKTERADGTLIAKAEGRIDGVNARDFEEAMKAAISGDDSVVVIDLENLSYISSAGLRVILLIAKTLRKRNAELMLCSLSDPIREVFEISGFDKIIPVHASRQQALSAVGNETAFLTGLRPRHPVVFASGSRRRAATSRGPASAPAGPAPFSRPFPVGNGHLPCRIRADRSPRRAPLRVRRASHPSSPC